MGEKQGAGGEREVGRWVRAELASPQSDASLRLCARSAARHAAVLRGVQLLVRDALGAHAHRHRHWHRRWHRHRRRHVEHARDLFSPTHRTCPTCRRSARSCRRRLQRETQHCRQRHASRAVRAPRARGPRAPVAARGASEGTVDVVGRALAAVDAVSAEERQLLSVDEECEHLRGTSERKTAGPGISRRAAGSRALRKEPALARGCVE